MSELYLGIDLGTGSCKTSLINQDGQILGLGSGKYISPTHSSDWKEQEPASIIQGMIAAVQQVIGKTNQPKLNIKAISIGAAQHGIMAVDKDGNPLTNVFTWADDRAASQAQRLKDSKWSVDLYQQTGCPPHGMYPLYKIIWLRENQPEIFKKTAKFISVKEYILQKLCGEYIVDYTIASATGLLNTHFLRWDQLTLELAQIETEKLSKLAGPRQTLSITNQSMADELGISANTPVILGSSDAVNSTLGAGALEASQATCMIGTSGAFRILSPQPLLHPNASSWCYCLDEEHWLVGGAINNGGLALSWLRDILQKISENDISFDDLLTYAQGSTIGADGVFCLPFFAGERSPNWNLDARAAFFGLSIEHDIRHISRAILEGIAFRLRSLDEVLKEMKVDIHEIRASGGFTQSDFWVQLVADVLGQPISVPAEGETSCLGAAFWAFWGIDPSTAFSDIKNWVKISKTYQPQSDAHSKYNHFFSTYKKLYQAVSPFF
ncbi:MAG: gluconokinase [Anaerolineales bacterium]